MNRREPQLETFRAARARPRMRELARWFAASLQGDPQLGPGELVVGPAGHEYPFLHFPLAPSQRTEINSILGRPPQGPAGDDDFVLPPEAAELWATAAAQGRLIDRPTYRLVGVRRENQALTLDAAIGRYRDSFVTQDWLERELLLAVAGQGSSGQEQLGELLARLPARAKLLKKLRAAGLPPAALLQGSRFRSAAIAVAVLLVFCDEAGAWHTPVRLRALAGPSVHAGMFHVVPSGMFQPNAGAASDPWDLYDCLYREYAEELFGESFDDRPRQDYEAYPPVRLLRALLADPARASLELVGYGYNVWNLRPEILLRLSIATPDWYRTHVLGDPPARWRDYGRYRLRFNDEFFAGDYPRFIPIRDRHGRPVPVAEMAEAFAQGLRAAGIEPVDGDPFHPAHWVPSGAAALWLAAR